MNASLWWMCAWLCLYQSTAIWFTTYAYCVHVVERHRERASETEREIERERERLFHAEILFSSNPNAKYMCPWMSMTFSTFAQNLYNNHFLWFASCFDYIPFHSIFHFFLLYKIRMNLVVFIFVRRRAVLWDWYWEINGTGSWWFLCFMLSSNKIKIKLNSFSSVAFGKIIEPENKKKRFTSYIRHSISILFAFGIRWFASFELNTHQVFGKHIQCRQHGSHTTEFCYLLK